MSSQCPEHGDRQPAGRGLDVELQLSGLSVAESNAPETLAWSSGPEPGSVLELCEKELAEQDSNPEKSVLELDEEESDGKKLEPSDTRNPKCGAGSDPGLAGEKAKPGEGHRGGVTGLDPSGLPEILAPCKEELLEEGLDPEHTSRELLGVSAASAQLLSAHPGQGQPLPPEERVEQQPCGEDQQN